MRPGNWGAVGLCVALAACGGGGGGGDSGGNAGGGTPVPRFAYSANFQDGTVSAFTVDAASGQLRDLGFATAGSNPASLTVSGSFLYVANYGSGDVAAFRIDAGNGALTAIDANAGTAGIQNFAAGTQAISVAARPDGKFLYVANYGANTVSAFAIDAATGALTALGAVGTGSNPNSITLDPAGKFAYVANRSSNTVSAYRIDAGTGALTAIDANPAIVGQQDFATGINPEMIAVDPRGKFAYVVNSGGNTVSAFAIDATSGALTGVGAAVPTGTAPHFVTVDPSGRNVYAVGAGGLSTYTIDASGALSLTSVKATGGAPFSVKVDPSGKFIYVADYSGDMLLTFSRNASTGEPTRIASQTARDGSTDIAMVSGKAAVRYRARFAQVANSSSDDASAYSLDATSGAPTLQGTLAAGNTPRDVAMDPSSRFAYVANEADDTLSFYTIDSISGALTAQGPVATGDRPTSVTIDANGRFAYVTNFAAGTLSAFGINAATGALTAIDADAGTAGVQNFTTGSGPIAMALDPRGRFAYVLDNQSKDVSVFGVNPLTGVLTSTGATVPTGTNPFGIAVTPSGRYAYVVDLTDDNISAFSINSSTGALTAIDTDAAQAGVQNTLASGDGPQTLSISPDGKFVFVTNFYGNSVTTFRIDPETGALTLTSTMSTYGPYGGRVSPDGKHLYVLILYAGQLVVYNIDPVTGSLSSTASAATGTYPKALAVSASIQ